MFTTIEAVPEDPILGLGGRVRADERSNKLDLTSGVYRDDTGNCPIFPSVSTAERQILDRETTKVYLPIPGSAEFGDAIRSLAFGASDGDRIRVAHTPGGTGGLGIAAKFLYLTAGPCNVWMSAPTWANHEPIFSQAGHEIRRYSYYDAPRRVLDFEAMLHDLQVLQRDDVVLLHGCCHNPTGRDLSLEQWTIITDLIAAKGALALVDFAYLGLAQGLDLDRAFLPLMVDAGVDLITCLSFSKNMGLYRERVGALCIVAPNAPTADSVESNIKATIRTTYSNPPSFGGQIATTILTDPTLRPQWESELTDMRNRLNGLRATLADAIRTRGLEGFEGFEDEYGMFTLTGLTPAQVEWLRVERAIYLLDSGRANLAGLTEATIPMFVDALADASKQ